MATVNNQTDFFNNENIDAMNLQTLINTLQKDKKAGGDQNALLLNLSKAIQEVVEEVNSGGNTPNSKVVTPNFKSGAPTPTPSNNSQVPSNASMQQAIGQLMGLLSELEGEIAKWGNDKSQINAGVGTSLLSEMDAQVKSAQDQLNKVLDSLKSSGFWGDLLKALEVVVGVVIAAIACLCGQPEIAAIVLVMTVLAVSGAMDKITQGISQLLQDMGVPPDVANVLASVIVIAITIAVTVMTCGAGAGAVAEEVTDATAETLEEGIEMTDMASNTAQDTATETTNTVSQVAEDGQQATSKWQQLKNFVQKIIDNTFGQLSKSTNLGIMAGSMAVGDTNFGQYLATLILSHMKDGKEKDALQAIIETIVDLMAALAGMGAGAAAASMSAAQQFNNVSNMLRGLQGLALGAGLAQGGAEFAQGATQMNLASETEALGEDQAGVTVSQALLAMINAQSASDNKTLSGQLKSHSEEMATLSADVVKEGEALTLALQA
ncbi:MAG: hypothetical protein JSS60_08280 [Verrucomicrobia bacterium]|nr:hypothetical protein [Verrucomicrobiota bacterium]